MIKARTFDVLVSPVFSEKATYANGMSKYTFKVNEQATKGDVKEAVEKIFEVEVKAVNILNTKGKKKVFKGRRGVRSGFKKAIITLKPGKTIDLGIGA
jgi:large subunit ribosomal protein L23